MILLWLLIVPLVASPLAFVLRKRHFMEAVNLAAFAVLLCLAAALGVQVLRSGSVSLWDGFLYADALSGLVVLLSAFVALVCSIYAVGYFRHDESNGVFQEGEELGGGSAVNKLREYYALTPLFVFSMILVALANNLGILWVAIEGTTLASVFLVMFYGRETSLEAAWKYAIIGGVGLSMALFGTILTYYSAHQALGTDTMAGLNWSVLVGNASQFDKATMRLAFILILLGYGTKAGIAPMHTWKPDAYSEAPIPGAAMLAAGVLNCALYGLVRFYILSSKCLGPGFASHLLILFGLLSMGVAVPFILVQKNFRRMLAYSSIDHSGIMVLALGFGRWKCPATTEDRPIPRGERRIDPFDALDRCCFSHGDSCGHRSTSLQFVSKRVHDSPRRVQPRLSHSSDSVHHLSRGDFLRIPHPHRQPCSWSEPRPSSI